jgi:hypothetical protein
MRAASKLAAQSYGCASADDVLAVFEDLRFGPPGASLTYAEAQVIPPGS